MLRNELVAITFQHLQVFYSVAETLNLTQSAHDLNLTQSSISKSLAKLENIVGYPLFDRTPKSVHLTPMGVAFYREWAQVLPMVEAGYVNATAKPLLYDEEISIVLPLTLDYSFIYNKLIEVSETMYPNLKLHFTDANMIDIPVYLDEGKCDLAFMPDVQKPDIDARNLSWHYIGIEHRCVIVSENHPLSQLSAVCLSDILEIPIIANPPERVDSAMGQIKKLYHSYGHSPTVVAYYTSNYEIPHLLRDHNCLLIADKYFPDIYLKGCKKIPLTDVQGGILASWNKKYMKQGVAQLLQIEYYK